MRTYKKKYHPITTFIIMSFFVIILSFFLSKIGFQSNYKLVNYYGDVTTVPLYVKNLFSRSGLRYIISDSFENFLTFKLLGYIIIVFISLGVAEATGFLKHLFRKFDNWNSFWLSFFIIFLGTVLSILDEASFVVLVPITARLFLHRKKNPLLGITMAYLSIATGWGTTLFASGLETKLVPLTKKAANILLENFHVPLLSNIFIMIASSFFISLVGTIIFEGIISKRFKPYNLEEEEFLLTEDEVKKEYLLSKTGNRYALITSFVIFLLFIYMIVPNLPLSGILLDKEQIGYTNQLFGPNAFFENSIIILMFTLVTGASIAYGIGANTIRNDYKLIEDVAFNLRDLGYVVMMMFSFILFISIFQESKIGLVIVTKLINVLENSNLTGVPLIVIAMILIALSTLFFTNTSLKWQLFSPIIVPLFAESNISPPFSQFMYRAADSALKGITPVLGAFAVYFIMMNIFNDEEEPIQIKDLMKMNFKYSVLILIFWIAFITIWYLLQLPIGPNTLPIL